MTTPALDMEDERLAVLRSLEILDTPNEREFDELTQVAALALGVQSAAVSLVDDHRQWFKARTGIPFDSTARDIAFCAHAVLSKQTTIVPDASRDPRFYRNPLVTDPGGVRFYAGVPLITRSGHCIGTFCVFDPVPRSGLDERQSAMLEHLANLAVDLAESSKSRRMGKVAAKVAEATTDAVVAADHDGVIVYWNEAAVDMFGHPAEASIGMPIEQVIPIHRDSPDKAAFVWAEPAAETQFIEMVGTRASGEEFPIEISLTCWGQREKMGGFAAIIRDVTRRKQYEEERDRSQAFLNAVIEHLPAMLFVKDTQSRQYVTVNRAGLDMIGLSIDQVLGRTDRELFFDGTGYEARDSLAIGAGKPQNFESIYRRPNGDTVHLRTTRAVIDGPDQKAQYLLAVSQDVTDTRLAEAEVRRLAHFDSLTGLLNRASFAERIERIISANVPFVMLSIDLDRFKAVNDQYGHLAGDDVLVEASRRLNSCLGPKDWMARVGGDEFVAVLLGSDARARATGVAECIVSSLAEPIATDRTVVYVGASVGVVVFPDDGDTIDAIRESADLAVYRAKDDGRGRACFFNESMDAEARDRRQLEKDVQAAVRQNDIELAYQPVVDVRTGQISSVEALARWNHAERGAVRPDVFIPVVEECGMISELGRNLMMRACADAAQWPEAIAVAVNMSPLQFLSGTLVDDVSAAIRATGINPNRIQLEVTENLLIRDVDGTFDQLERLRALGIKILMDDFGVGYSSLSYFQRFHFDKVKLDKSFIDGVITSPSAKAIIQSVVNLGTELGMHIVAEGVETEGQIAALIQCGCTHLQGYAIAKPLSPSALKSRIREQEQQPLILAPS